MSGRGGDHPDIVTVLGLSFKENVPDIRNSKVIDIIRQLTSFGVTVQVHDAVARAEDAFEEHGIKLTTEANLEPAAAVILAVAHEQYITAGLATHNAVAEERPRCGHGR